MSVTRPVAFEVPGPPIPKQRARRGRSGRWYTPAATRNYAAKVGWLARKAGMHQPMSLDVPVRLSVSMWFPDRRRRDADNVVKNVMDALNGIAWIDDSQVTRLEVTRGLDRERPRVVICVEVIE